MELAESLTMPLELRFWNPPDLVCVDAEINACKCLFVIATSEVSPEDTGDPTKHPSRQSASGGAKRQMEETPLNGRSQSRKGEKKRETEK